MKYPRNDLWMEFLREVKPDAETPVCITKPYKEYIEWLENKVNSLSKCECGDNADVGMCKECADPKNTFITDVLGDI